MTTNRKSKIKLIAPFVLGGFILPVLSGGFLAIDYIGYPNAPTPIIPYVFLSLGLLSAAVAHRLMAGTWEGVLELLHMTLSIVGLAYVVWALKYAIAGRSIHRFPAGLFVIISIILMISRVVHKYHAKFRAATQKSR